MIEGNFRWGRFANAIFDSITYDYVIGTDNR
jgi:hypothetical protein